MKTCDSNMIMCGHDAWLGMRFDTSKDGCMSQHTRPKLGTDMPPKANFPCFGPFSLFRVNISRSMSDNLSRFYYGERQYQTRSLLHHARSKPHSSMKVDSAVPDKGNSDAGA